MPLSARRTIPQSRSPRGARPWLTLTALLLAACGKAPASTHTTTGSGTGGGGATTGNGGAGGGMPTAACATGAVTATCLCGTKAVSSGYCCGTKAQATACAVIAPNALHVALTGDDADDGSAAHPFKTLEKARDAVRARKSADTIPTGGQVVYLRAGVYERTAPFVLAGEDAGTSDKPITWSAYPGESVSLMGGKVIPPAAWQPVSGSSTLFSVNLDAVGIDSGDYGSLVSRNSSDEGTNPPDAAMLEVFFDDVPMTLARWPNRGDTTQSKITSWAQIAKVYGNNGEFDYVGNEPAKWSAPTEAWVAARPHYAWQQEHSPITGLDLATKHLTIADGFVYSNSSSYTSSVFYAYNIFEELDAPGEYFLNKKTHVLYFYPPSPLPGSRLSVSLLGDRMLVVDSGASYLTFTGMTFEVSRSPLVDVKKGTDHITFDEVTVRNGASYGMSIDGDGNGIKNSVVSGTGDFGVSVGGTQGYVDNCELFDASRWNPLYNPPIFLHGTNDRATHNHIHDAPQQGIHFTGDHHLIAYNRMHHLVWDADDSGAIYTYKNYGATDVKIQYNLIYDIPWGFAPMGSDGGGVHAIYMDGGSGGIDIESNIIYGSVLGILLNGGVGHKMINNAIGSTVWGGILECDVNGKIPLTNIVSDRNVGDGKNFVFECTAGGDPVPATCTTQPGIFADHQGNNGDVSPLFKDPAAGDFHLRTDSPAFAIPGFQDIPVDQIGPR